MRARVYRPFLLVSMSMVATVTAVLHGGCQPAPYTSSVRALQRSGKVSFVCLKPPGSEGSAEEPLSSCSSQRFVDINSYAYADDAGLVDAGAGVLPHLYALITQTSTGEVAVVDTSAASRYVLDQNPIEPGANFLPVGAQPTGIVSTPGSVATFVGIGEVGRSGIFVLPSWKIRPASAVPGVGGSGGALPGWDNAASLSIPRLTSWPACALPAAPGDMILVTDPTLNGQERTHCDGDYAEPAGILSTHEQSGRQKLVVTLPDLGGLAVLDAQALYDLTPGSFDLCPVERWVPLQVDVTGYASPPPPAPADSACVNPAPLEPTLAPPYTPRPGGLAYANNTLYVADLSAPVVHVIDMPTPCEPLEMPPLLPVSAEEPQRLVTTGRIAASTAATPDYKRYVYATDVDDGSLMVFDVSPSSTTRRPLVRKHSEWNPFQPRDRIRYGAPAADILLVQRDSPETNPITGVALEGVRCNPSPNLLACTPTATTCDVARNYQTDTSSYQSGASPSKLRGTFALAALTSGKLAVIDVDDLDADCRGPATVSTLYGCAKNIPGALNTSLEQSCNVVEPNTPRSAYFEIADSAVGTHMPGLQTLPVLYNKDGATLDITDPAMPRMVAPLPADTSLPSDADPKLITSCDAVSGHAQPAGYTLVVGGPPRGPADTRGLVCPPDGWKVNTLAMNLEDPRAQVADQGWNVTYEGVIAGFNERLADLRYDLALGWVLEDPNSRFCDFGVQSQQAAKDLHGASAAIDWPRYADYVQITSPLPDELDPYWSIARDPACTSTYADCLRDFGSIDEPTARRDLRVVEAYQDHLELTQRPLPGAPDDASLQDLHALRCCFPGALRFVVRGGEQWIVNADLTGFLHHVVADPAVDPTTQRAGRCRNNCDPVLARKNGRVRDTTATAALKDGDPLVFQNPMFRFAIQWGSEPSSRTLSARDMTFRFVTIGAFVPLLASLSVDSTVMVQPQGMMYLKPTGEIAVTDGQLAGLLFMNLAGLSFSRSFY